MSLVLAMLEVDDDAPTATLAEGDASWHDGPGWYYIDDEYPDEGSCGAFSTRNEAIEHARAAGFRVDSAAMNTTDPETEKTDPEKKTETPMTEVMPTGTPVVTEEMPTGASVETPTEEPAPLTEEMPPEEPPSAA
jgi:hypothetical protein